MADDVDLVWMKWWHGRWMEWHGTQEEYEKIEHPDPYTIYWIDGRVGEDVNSGKSVAQRACADGGWNGTTLRDTEEIEGHEYTTVYWVDDSEGG